MGALDSSNIWSARNRWRSWGSLPGDGYNAREVRSGNNSRALTESPDFKELSNEELHKEQEEKRKSDLW
jgi:hypothetical protein